MRTKDIDKFYNESIRLLKQKDVLDYELKRAKKSLKACENEINKLNQWVKTL